MCFCFCITPHVNTVCIQVCQGTLIWPGAPTLRTCHAKSSSQQQLQQQLLQRPPQQLPSPRQTAQRCVNAFRCPNPKPYNSTKIHGSLLLFVLIHSPCMRVRACVVPEPSIVSLLEVLSRPPELQEMLDHSPAYRMRNGANTC